MFLVLYFFLILSAFLFDSSLCTVHAPVTMQITPIWGESRHSCSNSIHGHFQPFDKFWQNFHLPQKMSLDGVWDKYLRIRIQMPLFIPHWGNFLRKQHVLCKDFAIKKK